MLHRTVDVLRVDVLTEGYVRLGARPEDHWQSIALVVGIKFREGFVTRACARPMSLMVGILIGCFETAIPFPNLLARLGLEIEWNCFAYAPIVDDPRARAHFGFAEYRQSPLLLYIDMPES